MTALQMLLSGLIIYIGTTVEIARRMNWEDTDMISFRFNFQQLFQYTIIIMLSFCLMMIGSAGLGTVW